MIASSNLPDPKASRWSRLAIAFLWVTTGLLVFHPYYQQVGAEYLDRLGLPYWVVYVTCAGEVVLGLRVALGPATDGVTALQVALIMGFTVILAWVDPVLLSTLSGL